MSGAGWAQVRRFPTLPSTNTYVLEEARCGAEAGLVVVADHQTAGRGRLGRTWEAPSGTCLLASVLLRPLLPAAQLYLCTAAVALAAADACRAAAGVEPGVKWPNDLVVGDRKLAGILAEADFGAPGGRPGSTAVVAGIGLNVGWPGPPGAGGTSLRREGDGRATDCDAVLEALLDALEPRVRGLDDPAGRADLAGELRRRCATLGRRVRVELPVASEVGPRVIVGLAVALTDDGHLVVEAADGRHEVSAADVVHLRPETVTADGPPGAPHAVG